MARQSSFTSRMHRAAALYYESQPNAVQQELCTLFQRLDVDGDGRITEAELKSLLNVLSLFALLDSDGNGELDFEECKCLFFLVKQEPEACAGCEKLLLEGKLYVCVECNAFYLCPTCYGARNNLRPVHPHSNFSPRPPLITGVINEIIDRNQRGVVSQPRSASPARVVLQARSASQTRAVLQPRSAGQPRAVSQVPSTCLSSLLAVSTVVQTANAAVNLATLGASLTGCADPMEISSPVASADPKEMSSVTESAAPMEMSSVPETASPVEMSSVTEHADPEILNVLVEIVASGCSIM
ncbi:hypothetical protein KP509_14G041400 [Ceratopteris richardii]|uniref:EF-hand domain-containing protein n=1 Tax=Ceratopteris richardii TaxID=49495 RepID=A0A8T2TCF4_CERRI|nr:hypothetical protein KP509_14G041400 [Ceratopteris richardii]